MIETYRVRTVAGWWKVVLELSKIRISQLVALSALLGYILATGTISWGVWLPVVGTFLLAAGSSALNQLQERNYDRMMHRTRQRPLPAGKISAQHALLIATGLLAAGAILLGASAGPVALLLGLFNVAWYNGVYTPLKRITAWAIFPGSLIGAIPPVIGWVAGDGKLSDPLIWAVALFFFVWQVPHYWLLLANFGEDYRRADFPTLTEKYARTTFARITWIWIIATTFTSLLIPLTGIHHSNLLDLGLIGVAVWLLWEVRALLAGPLSAKIFRAAFLKINVYMLLVMMVLTLDRLII